MMSGIPDTVKIKTVGGQDKLTFSRTYKLRFGNGTRTCEICGEEIRGGPQRYARSGWNGAEFAHIECVLNPMLWDGRRVLSAYTNRFSCGI